VEVAVHDPLQPAVRGDPLTVDAPAVAIAERLAPVLGHSFTDPSLLVEALTHGSAASPGRKAYERLEFLGDRVLGLVIAEALWRRFPDEAEGPLTRRHTQLVRRETLAAVGGDAGLAAHIILSPGEDAAATRENLSLLADVVEAVIAALYLDGGLDAAARFIRRFWEERIGEEATPPRDAKTALQEWTQARNLGLPRYETVEIAGPAHRRVFTAAAAVGGEQALGTGPSKRTAETEAAAALLARITGSSPVGSFAAVARRRSRRRRAAKEKT
jgi:ribonuclease III